VPSIDMSKPIGQRRFSLHAILMWLVHDFLAYGLLSGQQTKGYKGCPLCGEETCAQYLGVLKKMTYLGGRCFLHWGHRFRNAKTSFNGQSEGAPTLERQSATGYTETVWSGKSTLNKAESKTVMRTQ